MVCSRREPADHGSRVRHGSTQRYANLKRRHHGALNYAHASPRPPHCHRLCRVRGQHSAHPPPGAVQADWLRDLRQVRVPQPWRLRQGSRGARHHSGRGALRRPEAGRHDRRGHRWEHGHRACVGGKLAWLQNSHRHSRDADAREEGGAPPARRAAGRGEGTAVPPP